MTYAGRDLTGELIFEWGDVRLRRAVSFPSPGTRTFELYVRTGEPTGSVRVRLQSGGSVLASADAIVRVLAPEDAVTICVTSSSSEGGDVPDCAAHVAIDALPSSPRGYEVVDRLVWPDGTDASGGVAGTAARDMNAGQRRALEGWRAVRRLDASGDLSLAPQPARPSVPRGLPRSTLFAVGGGTAAYLGCVLLAGRRLGTRGRKTSHAYAALGAAIVGGSAAAATIGHAGPARAIEIHHSSLLQQMPGTDRALLTMRGIAAFPALASYALDVPMTDATIERSSATGPGEQIVDADGHPVLAGTFGLAARQAFVVEGVTELQPIRITTEAHSVTVSNTLDHPLESCRFGDGLSEREIGVLAAGASATAHKEGGGIGPLLTCTMPGLPMAIDAGDRPIAAIGSTVIAVYRPATWVADAGE